MLRLAGAEPRDSLSAVEDAYLTEKQNLITCRHYCLMLPNCGILRKSDGPLQLDLQPALPCFLLAVLFSVLAYSSSYRLSISQKFALFGVCSEMSIILFS